MESAEMDKSERYKLKQIKKGFVRIHIWVPIEKVDFVKRLVAKLRSKAEDSE